MAAGVKYTPYFIGASLVALLTFYYIFDIRSKNTSLATDVKFYKEALRVSKVKNIALVEESQKKLDQKDVRIKQLDEENMAKHTALGSVNSKLQDLKKQVMSKSSQIEQLHKQAASHKDEISNLKNSVLQTKEALGKLSEKAGQLMSNHTQLKLEKHGLQKRNEDLQNEVNQHQSNRGALGERMRELIKKNELLERKVAELTEKNNIIKDSIQKKIREGYPAYGTTASQRSRVTINKNDEAHVVGGEVPNPVARAVTSRETSPLVESQRTANHGTLEKSDSQREQLEGVDSVEGRQMYANDRIMVNNDNITQRGIPLNDETRSD